MKAQSYLVSMLALAVSLGGVVMSTSDAQAQGKQQRIAVFVNAGGSSSGGLAKLARRLQNKIRTQVSQLAGLRVVTGSPGPRTNVIAKIRPLVEQGFRALNERKGAVAEPIFQKAYDQLIRYTGPFEKRLMARITKGLGVARALEGKDRGAQEMMRASLNLWPDQEASEYAYTLDVRSTFKNVVKVMAQEAKGSINVASDPPGGVVRLAGGIKGFTPNTISGVTAGPHWVSVQLDGYGRTGAFVDVIPGKVAAHGLALQAVPNAEAYATLMAGVGKGFKRMKKARAALENLRTFLGADAVLFLRLSPRNGLTLTGYYAQGAQNTVAIKNSFDANAELLTNIEKWIKVTLGRKQADKVDPLPLDAPPQASVVIGGADSVFIDPNDPILATPKKAQRDSITSKWWFWAIVGGAAAGVTSLVVVLLGEQGQARGPVGNISIKLNPQ